MKNFSHIISICDCNPQIHLTCINNWLSKSSSCPICRKNINIVVYNSIKTNYIKSFTWIIVFFNLAFTLLRVSIVVSIFNIAILFSHKFIIVNYLKYNTEI